MRAAIVWWLGLVASACAATAEAQPADYELSWAKRGVAYDAFVIDVDQCNAAARAAAQAVPPRRGSPENDDLIPYIWVWRWFAHGADMEAAMAEAYQACFAPRGYRLIYVPQAEAQALRELPFGPIDESVSFQERRATIRDAQMRMLHRWATAEHPLRARRLEPRMQPRHLVALTFDPLREEQ